jgi:ribosome-associated toxin RatA of RatAB toxin-antitoxin module
MQLDDNEKQKEMSLLKRRFVVLDGGWSFMSVKSMGRIIE